MGFLTDGSADMKGLVSKMGFGILFVGYALTFGQLFFSTYFFCDIVGSIIMVVSLMMLSEYCRKFKWAAAAAGGLTAVYAAAAVLRMMGYSTPDDAEKGLIGERIYDIVQYIVPVTTLVFTVLLLAAASILAKDVGLKKIVRRNILLISVICVYYAVWWVFDLLSYRISLLSVRIYNVIGSGLTLLQAVWFIVMILSILSWMKWIAPAEQVEAEERGDDSVEGGSDGVLTRIGVRLNRLEEHARTKKEDRPDESGVRSERDPENAKNQKNYESDDSLGEDK